MVKNPLYFVTIKTAIVYYSVYRSYEVQSSLTLIPCFDAAHPSSLFPLLYSLFPVPCSLFPTIHKLYIS
ncbi:MAG: hypothetical protein F6K55_44000 [Moorea sp. SIO4A3]|nr:hypothetical protein [Moorena sp. SIO4A3]